MTEPDFSTTDATRDVTRLLLAWNGGDNAAAERLTEIVYGQVRAIAGRHLRQFDQQVTLNATELAHELFMRLLDSTVDWRDRRHFYAVVAVAMRNLLIDLARARASEKRGGAQVRVTLSAAEDQPAEQSEPLQLDAALSDLRGEDPRKAEVIELTYYLGLKREEIAATLGVSVPTVDRELRFARAWLRERLAA